MSEIERKADALAERGNELFERRVRPRVNVERDARKFVAIDTESGDYEVDRAEMKAIDRLLERRPAAKGRIWLRRVGSESAHRMGGRFQAERGNPS